MFAENQTWTIFRRWNVLWCVLTVIYIIYIPITEGGPQCSDFSCCNLQLADLHALVEHVEEQHIDGIRIHSDPIPSRPPPQHIPHVYTPFNLAAMLNYIEPEFNPDPYPIFMHDDDLPVDIPPSIPDKKSKTRISKRKERTYRCPVSYAMPSVPLF